MAFNMFGTYCTKDQGFPRTVLRQRRRGHQKFGGDAISESTPVSVAKIYRLGEGIMSSLVQSGPVKAVVLDFWWYHVICTSSVSSPKTWSIVVQVTSPLLIAYLGLSYGEKCPSKSQNHDLTVGPSMFSLTLVKHIHSSWDNLRIPSSGCFFEKNTLNI